MKVNVFAAPSAVTDGEHTLAGCFIVVVDTLRATTTMLVALKNGAREILPVGDVGTALATAGALGRSRVLLGGERRGLPIEGFDVGNSPLEYTADRVAGRTVVMTTTNGTRAIAAAQKAGELVIGAMNNASAAACAAADSGREVTILMSGTGGRFSLEDALTAGAILDALPGVEPDDLGQACRALFSLHSADLVAALKECAHARYLRSIGYEADIAYAMARDTLSLVPRVTEGRVLGPSR